MAWKPEPREEVTFTTSMTADQKARMTRLIAKHAHSESWLIERLLEHWADCQEFPTQYEGHGWKFDASWMGLNPDVAIVTGGPNGDMTYKKIQREVRLDPLVKEMK